MFMDCMYTLNIITAIHIWDIATIYSIWDIATIYSKTLKWENLWFTWVFTQSWIFSPNYLKLLTYIHIGLSTGNMSPQKPVLGVKGIAQCYIV